MNDLGHAADPSVWLAFVLFTFLNLMFLSGLIYANWDMVKRTAWSIAAGLLGLLALPFWLGYELLRWLWDKLAHMAMLNP